jgi:hypothetical protein
MPGPPKIKIIFGRVLTTKSGWSGTGDLVFTAMVDGRPAGNASTKFTANPNAWIDLPADQWSGLVNVLTKTDVQVSFLCKRKRFFSDDDLGGFSYKVKKPWVQQNYQSTNRFLFIEWRVELEVEGAFGFHPPDSIFACREANGSLACNTVSGGALVERIEFCPIRPVPAAAVLPPRPAFPPGAPAPVLNGAAVPPINPGDPINIVPNPAVIPILQPADAKANTAAKIEFTYYRAPLHNFTDDDARLKWTATAISGGSVAFVGPACGRKILVYGKSAGEVKLECRFQGNLMGEYRALVGEVKKIPCRFNILNGPAEDSRPRATPGNVRDHLAIANRFLRQLAVELVPDTDASTKDGARATTIPGIFRIACAAGLTRNVGVTGFMAATKLNYRPNVMNFAYIHSDRSGNLGAADAYPASGAGATITDNGSPSSSWKVPSGVKPDTAASPVVMTLLAARLRPGHPNLVSMYVTDGPNGDPSKLADMQTYAGTIAHEFGHNLNLAHRVDTPASPFNDNVNHPPAQNVMHWNNPTTIAQDFDIIQAKAARQSPIIPP